MMGFRFIFGTLTLVLLVLHAPPLFSQQLEVEGEVDVKNNQIKNVADPIDSQDAVTKAYVDAMSEILLNAGINGAVQDVDGNVYKTVKIGTQVWMVENLRTTRYNDGTTIPKITHNTLWNALTTPGYCWYGDDSTMNAKVFGALYNYYTIADTNTLNVCPVGWDVPSDTEFTMLVDFLTNTGYGYQGNGTDIGKSMAAPFRWSSSASSGHVGNDQGTNNSSGFSGLPGGYRNLNGIYSDLGNYSYWWSATVSGASAWSRYLDYDADDLNQSVSDKRTGLSVRCLRD